MASTIKPVVEVFQEFKSQVVTPATPELESILIGPIYFLMDPTSTVYTTDKVDGKSATDYGTETPASTGNALGPTPAEPHITLATPPGAPAASQLETSSVKVYFDTIWADVAHATDGVVWTDQAQIRSAAPKRLVGASRDATTETNGDTVTFLTADVDAGDRVVMTETAGVRKITLAAQTFQTAGILKGDILNVTTDAHAGNKRRVSLAGQALSTAGVKEGDRLIISAAAVTAALVATHVVLRVLSETDVVLLSNIAAHDGAGEAVTYKVTRGPSDTVVVAETAGVTFTSANVSMAGASNLSYIIETVISQTELELKEQCVGRADTNAGNITGTIKRGSSTLVTLTTISGTTAALARTLTNTVQSVSDGTNLVLANNIPSGFGATGILYRVEGKISPMTLIGGDDSAFVDVGTAGANSIVVNGGVTIVDDNTTLVREVNYAKVYTKYRALRTDKNAVTEIDGASDITTAIGRILPDNPLAVALQTYFLNSTATVKWWGIDADNLNGETTSRLTAYSAALTGIESLEGLYCVVPLTQDLDVIDSFRTQSVALADSKTFRPRMILGSPAEILAKVVSSTATDGSTEAEASGPASSFKTWLDVTGGNAYLTGGGDKPVQGVQDNSFHGATLTDRARPGDRVEVTASTPSNLALGSPYTVSKVRSDTRFEITGEFPNPPGGQAYTGVEYRILRDTDLDGVYETVVHDESGGGQEVTVEATDTRFETLFDANADFITDNVTAGDYIRVYVPVGTPGTDYVQLKVASRTSAQRVKIDLTDTTTLAELPQGVSQAASGGVTTALKYSINRTLTKAQQVTDLSSVATSREYKRLVLVWPSRVDLSFLSSYPNQPGYYLCSALAGLISSLPPQQGFTYLGLAGFSKLYYSNFYFNESQLGDLSDAGFFVYKQETPSGLPYAAHQLTSLGADGSIEERELSHVKNFDFVSTFFKNILKRFLGRWNAIEENLGFLRTDIGVGIKTLKIQRKPRIGPPLVEATITLLQIDPLESDTINLEMDVKMPKVINKIRLRQTSV